MCGQCKGSNVEVRNRNSVNGEIYICNDCGSLNIEIKLEIQRSCPGCRLSSIIPIAKKRLQLIKRVRDVVSGFKTGYEELKTFLREYRAIRQKTLALRAVGYLHDPIIEQTLLSIYETIKSVSDDILERATQEMDLVRIQLGKYCDSASWRSSDFPQLEMLIKQIQEDVIKYQLNVRKILAQPKKEQGLVKSKLKVIKYYKSIYDEYNDYLNLFPGELPVCAFKEITFCKSTIQGLRKGTGLLFLTDQRLIFIRKTGFIKKSVQRLFNFSFNHFLDVSFEGRLFKKLKFILDQGNIWFSASNRTMEAIKEYLNISVNFGKYRINDNKVLNTLDQIQISTRHLEREIDRKIVQLLSGPSDKLISDQRFEPPSATIHFSAGEAKDPNGNLNRMLFKLQSDKFSIEQSISNLERKFRTGTINPGLYITQFRRLQSELFTIEKELETVQSVINESN